MILTSGKGMILSYFFAHKPLSEGLPALHYISYFLRKGIMKSTLLCVWWIAPQLDYVQSVQFGFSLGMRLCGKRFGYLQGVVFMKNFWNFKVVPNKNHVDVCLKQTCFEKFKRFSWICLHKCWKFFALLLVKKVKWSFVGQSSSSFNLRVSKNWFSKHSFCLHE